MQFHVLKDQRWKANIEAKQGRFQLDRYRTKHDIDQHGNMVYNAREHERIPNATDNPWTNYPVKNPEHEYHVIHTLSVQLNNITLSFDVKSESIYYGKTRINCDIERGYCPQHHAI